MSDSAVSSTQWSWRRRLRDGVRLLLIPLLITAHAAFAQDELRVTSPNGQIDFRLFIGSPEPGSLSRLAYQVFFRGKRLIDMSFLALDIYTQEPMLGENLGLISSSASSDDRAGFHALTARYMQNGSIGRLLNLEVRAYDDGVAFRYIVPQSTPLMQILIADEATEFRFAQAGNAYLPQGKAPLSAIGAKVSARLPIVVSEAGVGWVEINQAGAAGYPETYLTPLDKTALVTRLALSPVEPHLAWEQMTPLVCPWRVLAIAPDRETLVKAGIVQELNR